MNRNIRNLLCALLALAMLLGLAACGGQEDRSDKKEAEASGTADIQGGVAADSDDSITGLVTDVVTGRPLKGVTVICEGGEVTAEAVTDESGRYRFSDLPVGTYQIRPAMDACEEADPVTVEVSGKTAALDLALRPSYAQAYADYLMANQAHDTSASEYGLGQGRFALAYITDDQIPELLVIDIFDTAIVSTCDNGEVRSLRIEEGNSDIPRYNYKTIRYNEEGLFASNWVYIGDTLWSILQPPASPPPDCDFVMTARLIEGDGKYCVNVYDENKMRNDGYMYLMEEYVDNPVSKGEYEAAWHSFGLDSADIRSIEEDDVYLIVPAVIRDVFACD